MDKAKSYLQIAKSIISHLDLYCLIIYLLLILTTCSVREKKFAVKFEGASAEKKWAIKELNPDMASDWSSYGFLTFEMRSTTTQRFEIRIFDAEGIRRISMHPFQNAWIRASIPLVHFQRKNTTGATQSAINKTPRPGYWIGFSNAVGNIKHVDSIGVFMARPVGSQILEIRNMQLTMAAQDTVLGPNPVVDEFGQWIPDDWPGKAKTIGDLQAAWRSEEESLDSGGFKVSKYGGFLDARVKATGFFRVEKIDGRWWFVDPEGYLFFSTGITGINSRSADSRIAGREYIFKELPPAVLTGMRQPGGAAAGQPSGKPGNTTFYSWNLYRRYGTEWRQKWMDMAARRMDSWGINTIANWSDNELGPSRRKPYVVSIGGWGNEARLMGLPDVYAPGYTESVDASASRQCAGRKDDPYLLGYFIGNELPWPGREQEVAEVILAGEESPVKTALKNYLADGDTPERRKAFAYETYARFLSTVNAAIRKYDPNHLNLGIRYGGSAPDEVIAASKGFDVFSITVYRYSLDQTTKKIYELSGLPVIVGEFHFGTPGRGMAPGLGQVKDQEERGVAYRYYVENGAADPALVGIHWFQWIDQPSTGRNDGENYNIGFVDVTDRPYQTLVDASRETFKRLYGIHAGTISPVTRQTQVQ